MKTMGDYTKMWAGFFLLAIIAFTLTECGANAAEKEPVFFKQ